MLFIVLLYVNNYFFYFYFQGDSLPLVPCDVAPMLAMDEQPVTQILEGSKVGRGNIW